MARRRAATPDGEHVEPLVEALDDLAGRQRARPAGGELDREREPVEPAAQLDDRVVLGARAGGGRAVEEERRGVLAREPHQPHDLLAVDAQRRAAGRHDAQVGTARQQLLDHGGGAVEHVLAVVEQEQAGARRELLEAALEGQRVGDRAGHVGVGADGTQLAPPRALREVDPVGQLERQPRLAGAADARHGQQAAVAQQLLGPRQVLLAAEEAAGARRQPPRGRPRRAGQAGLVDEDAALELARGGARLEPELGQAGAERPQRLEGLDLAAGAVERQRMGADELLLERLGGDQALELGQRLVVAPELDQRARPALGGALPQLLQPPDLGLRELRVRDVAERRAAPQGERLVVGGERRLRHLGGGVGDQALEPDGVDLVEVGSEPVAGAVADEQRRRRAGRPAGLEVGAQVGEPDGQRARGRLGVGLRPGRLDQRVGRDHAGRLQQQPREDRPLLDAGRRGRVPVVDDLEWPQDPKLHVATL